MEIVSTKSGDIQGFQHCNKGDTVAVGRRLRDVSPPDYDGLMLPGGAINCSGAEENDGLNVPQRKLPGGGEEAASQADQVRTLLLLPLNGQAERALKLRLIESFTRIE